ncbi:MAG: hypothetical protein IPI97_03770 [Nitrosomonas sp.]|nr:hypothetical protein [Nitrosomonas sp.]MBK7364150.1 hypothetical protein [Nitrosomonas sp.]
MIKEEAILILAKTYPSPSAKYAEISCIAGINKDGSMRRLYPIPFRMLEKGKQFKKWQWIQAKIEKANQDHRPESYKLYTDTIQCLEQISSKNGWNDRLEWLNKVPSFHSVDSINTARANGRLSIAMIHPQKLIELEIKKAKYPDWTDEEKNKLISGQMQGNLFSESDAQKQVKILKKVPFDFYYKYLCDTPDGEREYTHKIVDWEAAMLFWNCFKNCKTEWEKPFREKLLNEFRENKELIFLMGNQHRFQNQWLIVSLIYPPKRKPVEMKQGSLF